MSERAVVLLSGGLDSMLAIRILQEQGLEVEALNFQTMFTCCKDTAAQMARELGVRLTIIGQEDDYVELIRSPRYGYGKGANPCVDCRIYMFQRAKKFMEDIGACVVASGEVLGQRPKSQKRRDLAIIGKQSGLADLLLRPLSALLLPPTLPERNGQIDRAKLYGFSGRSRKGLISLARHFDFKTIPSPSTGCSLTEKSFAPKVHDLIQIDPESQRWDFELLNLGRHLRIDSQTKVTVGRNEAENDALLAFYRQPESRGSAFFTPKNFYGPNVLLTGPATESNLKIAGGLMLRYSNKHDPENAVAIRDVGGASEECRIEKNEKADALAPL